MSVRKIESRIPGGFSLENAQKLGQAVVYKQDNIIQYALVSHLSSPLRVGPISPAKYKLENKDYIRNVYNVFVNTAKGVNEPQEYSWHLEFFNEFEEPLPPIRKTTTYGEYRLDTFTGPPELKDRIITLIKVTVTVDGNTLGPLVQDVEGLMDDLEALIRKDNESRALGGDPTISRILKNDYGINFEHTIKNNPSTIPVNLVASLIYSNLQRTNLLDFQNELWPKKDIDHFKADTAIGLLKAKPHVIAHMGALIIGAAGGENSLRGAEESEPAYNKRTYEWFIKSLQESQQIDVVNLLRFPKSSIQEFQRLFEEYRYADPICTNVPPRDLVNSRECINRIVAYFDHGHAEFRRESKVVSYGDGRNTFSKWRSPYIQSIASVLDWDDIFRRLDRAAFIEKQATTTAPATDTRVDLEDPNSMKYENYKESGEYLRELNLVMNLIKQRAIELAKHPLPAMKLLVSEIKEQYFSEFSDMDLDDLALGLNMLRPQVLSSSHLVRMDEHFRNAPIVYSYASGAYPEFVGWYPYPSGIENSDIYPSGEYYDPSYIRMLPNPPQTRFIQSILADRDPNYDLVEDFPGTGDIRSSQCKRFHEALWSYVNSRHPVLYLFERIVAKDAEIILNDNHSDFELILRLPAAKRREELKQYINIRIDKFEAAIELLEKTANTAALLDDFKNPDGDIPSGNDYALDAWKLLRPALYMALELELLSDRERELGEEFPKNIVPIKYKYLYDKITNTYINKVSPGANRDKIIDEVVTPILITAAIALTLVSGLGALGGLASAVPEIAGVEAAAAALAPDTIILILDITTAAVDFLANTRELVQRVQLGDDATTINEALSFIDEYLAKNNYPRFNVIEQISDDVFSLAVFMVIDLVILVLSAKALLRRKAPPDPPMKRDVSSPRGGPLVKVVPINELPKVNMHMNWTDADIGRWQDLERRVRDAIRDKPGLSNLRKALKSGHKVFGFADIIDNPGLPYSTLEAISSETDLAGLVKFVEEKDRFLKTRALIKTREGLAYMSKSGDVEAKLLEKILEDTASIPYAEFTVRIFVNHKTCPACQGVIRQFVERRPNIHLEIVQRPRP